MSSLFIRLSLVFSAILLCLGMVTLNIGHRSQQRYFEEFTQELNRPVAMYMVNQTRLFIDGKPDKQALAELAVHLAMINPSLDVFLLDPQGNILAGALDVDVQYDQAVDMQPLQRFIAGQDRLPIYGVNPSVPGQLRVFSAFPVSGTEAGNSGCEPCGYVYVVLGGARHRSLWHSLSSSYTLQAGATMFGGVLVFALFAGIAVFFMMTRPLRAMTRALSEWRLAAVDQTTQALPPKLSAGRMADELQALEQTCHGMAKRLDQQFIALNKADKQRRRFLTSVSHDLRTPLTSLSGAIETVLLKHEQLTPSDSQRYLLLAQRQANRLRSLISQLFEMARLDSGDVKPQIEQMSLSELVFDTVQDMEAEASRVGIALTVSSSADSTNVIVLADMSMIQRVLENLVFNAIRHTPEGGHVSVTVGQDADLHGVVEVADSGRGFATPMDACPLMVCIDQGEVMASMNSAMSEGSGLGLGIVQRILVLHGSQALVWSQPGEGTRVKFSLPLSV
ncbi:sensor histidine kinase [Granulosicoccus antarcticus]|uniref:histidine kinase n=1 Tax=Granulosicoccus antarcticus IMCC3135 TaxID=1192854 RepID=A0A2Z2NKF4_9GAMM|nr:HAMP domain-containing sensor histidine kinase [Granulosicoccus antarcticus]ASJ71872.1 Non-motile and phage-resistance protein [Granulosicoccus antarcticus IMCC3135]